MKLIPGNIFFFLKKTSCLFVFCIFIFATCGAQNSATADSTVAPVTPTGDSTTTIMSDEQTSYFERGLKQGVADTGEFRAIPLRYLDSLRQLDEFWYANKSFKKNESKREADPVNRENDKTPSRWMSLPMFILIVLLFIGLLGWYLFQNNIIRRPVEGARNDAETFDDENIFDIDYQSEIEKATQSGDYRLAVRFMFLRALKMLSENNIITYKQEKTNFDYMAELGNTDYYHDFYRLARNYEYSWYGKFNVSRQTFDIIKTDFENFDARLS